MRISEIHKISASTEVFINGKYYGKIISEGRELTYQGFKMIKSSDSEKKKKAIEAIHDDLLQSIKEKLISENTDWNSMETLSEIFVDGTCVYGKLENI